MTCNCSGRAGLPWVLAAAGVLLAASGPASAINRCEGRDGRVTYTDEPCPATARSARRVDGKHMTGREGLKAFLEQLGFWRR